MQNGKDVELIRLKARAVDSGHLKLATWGTKEELTDILIDNFADRYQSSDVGSAANKELFEK